MYLIPAMLAIAAFPIRTNRDDNTRVVRLDSMWVLAWLSFCLLIGFRFEVGGDWGNYRRYLLTAMSMDFKDIPIFNDPAFWFLNIASLRLGFGGTGVNVAGGILFTSGLVAFCRSLPRPWVALAVSVPYLIIVVAMGYNRQGIAIGLVMLGFVALSRRNFIQFALWTVLAAMFHKSAIMVLPLAAIAFSRRRSASSLLIVASFVLGYSILLRDSVDELVSVYVDENIASSGALVRLAMNAVPAGVFLIYGRRFIISESEFLFYRVVSLLSVGMLLAFFVTSISTALDRMALYVIPLQMFVFAHLPDALGRRGGRNQSLIWVIVSYYLFVLIIWLTMADHSHFWLPFRLGFS